MSARRGSFPIIACFLTLCFTAIVMYVLFEVLSLQDKPGGSERIAFSVANSVILIGLASLGGAIRRLASIVALAQLWCVTTLYTIFQFGAVFVKADGWHGKPYILYQLIALFLYLCVALPVLKISYGKNGNQTEED